MRREKKYVPNKKTGQKPRKRANETEVSCLVD